MSFSLSLTTRLNINQIEINFPEHELDALPMTSENELDVPPITRLSKNQTEVNHPENKQNVPLNRHQCGITFNSLDKVNKIYIEFSNKAPRWRVVNKGLNFEARCVTKSCIAYNKNVWVTQGMGEFDVPTIIFNKSAICPICLNSTDDPKNIGLFDCKYTIQGRMIKPERKKIDETDIANSKNLTTFLSLEAQWLDLVITVSKV